MRCYVQSISTILVLATGTALADDAANHALPAEPAAVTQAVATLNPTVGSKASGTVRFAQADGGVHVVASITGLTPGRHGFHVHEKGDCSDPEGKSAGGHFNPGGHEHGAPGAHTHHAGDLGNLTADAAGQAQLDATFKGLSLSGPQGLVGRGLIVHAEGDDLSTQPTGNAGARVACAVIEATTTP